MLNLQSFGPSGSDCRLLQCSHCSKTGKPCSLNRYWGEPHTTSKSPSVLLQERLRGKHQHGQRKKRQRIGTASSALGGMLVPASQSLGPSAPTCGPDNGSSLDRLAQFFDTPSSNYSSMWNDHAFSVSGTFTDPPSYRSDPIYTDIFAHAVDDSADMLHAASTAQQSLSNEISLELGFSFECPSGLPSWSDSSSSHADAASYAWPDSTGYTVSEYGQADGALMPVRHDAPQSSQRSERDSLRTHSTRTDSMSDDIPCFNADRGIMTSTNNSIITDSLLGIYHDVLENNLACWLSEDTCPYKVRSVQELTTLRSKPVMPPNSSREAYGATWSNRVYGRIVQLDRVAQKLGQLRLTRSENRAASKALSLAMMAFATQWSQGKRRSELYRISPLDTSVHRDVSPGEGDEFEENIRESTYEQAKQALRDCSDVESYRVVYAELVFGLTQIPQPCGDKERNGKPTIDSLGRAESFVQKKQKIVKLLAQRYVSVERATRKVHAMKFRINAVETGFSVFSTGQSQAQLLAEDRSTIGLLYWLAVMLDTVSSSMSERPVALADEDCQHEDLGTASNRPTSPLRQRWDDSLFVQDDLEQPTLLLSWPCTYDDAAEAVTRSAPVKVLLFRYIACLQNTLRKRDFGRAVEDIVSGAMALHKYWATTYSSFFRGLITDYDNVPARIKSWFVCIVVPWNLGALMLADLIEFIDQNNMGLKQASCVRITNNLPALIRKASADELSDIALVTTPTQHGSDNRQLPEYHFAISQGSLLAEPWTALLVNAFAKAALYHLEVVDEICKQGPQISLSSQEISDDALRRARSCAQCLWFLGSKSPVASDVAMVLLGATTKLT